MKFGIGFLWWERTGLGSGKSLNRAEAEGLGAARVGFGGEVGVGLKLGLGLGLADPTPTPPGRFLSKLGCCWELALGGADGYKLESSLSSSLCPGSRSVPPAIFFRIHIRLPVSRGHREGLGWERECRVPCHPRSLCARAMAG